MKRMTVNHANSSEVSDHVDDEKDFDYCDGLDRQNNHEIKEESKSLTSSMFHVFSLAKTPFKYCSASRKNIAAEHRTLTR